METIESSIESVVTILQKLDGAPAIALVFVSCIVTGYALKLIPQFPNQAIPLAVIAFGSLLNPIISDMNVEIPLRIWMIRGVLVGGITGFVAWMSHALIISRIEDKLGLFGQKKDKPNETQPHAETPATPAAPSP